MPVAALTRSGVNGGDERGVVVEARGVRGDEPAIDRAARDQELREAVEEHEIALRRDRVVARRGERGLGGARVDHEDLGAIGIAADALPEDRVRNAQIGADEHDHVGFLEVAIGVGRRVEAERLLVRGRGGGHALPRVGVAVHHAHPELRERAEEEQVLGGDLSRAQERHRLAAVSPLHAAHARDELVGGAPPRHRPQRARRVAQERRRRAVGRGERSQCLPALRTCHAEIHWIVGGGREVHRAALAQVHGEPAPGGAEAADDVGGRVGREPRGHLAEPEAARGAHQLARERSVRRAQQTFEHRKKSHGSFLSGPASPGSTRT
jgi:hypothetical protein